MIYKKYISQKKGKQQYIAGAAVRISIYIYLYVCSSLLFPFLRVCSCTENAQKTLLLTLIFGLLGALQVPPLGAHQPAQLPEGEVGVPGLDDGPHLAAEQDVAAHVDLPLGALLLGHALYLRSGLLCKTKQSTQLGQGLPAVE